MSLSNEVTPSIDPPTGSSIQGRFFSTRQRGLLTMHADGSMYIKRPEHDWQLFKRAPESAQGVEERLQQFDVMCKANQAWRSQVYDVPSAEELGDWILEGVCDTPTGHSVEPDGVGPDGVPSWLRCFGLI